MSFDRRTLHFHLAHLGDLAATAEFSILGADNQRHRLIPYAEQPGKLDEHLATNRALALLDDSALRGITHFLDGVPLGDRHASIQQVSFPSITDHPLQEIGLRFVHIPRRHVVAAARRNRDRHRLNHPVELAFHGIAPDAFDLDDLHDLRVDLADLVGPASQAKSYLFMHPEIGSINPSVAQTVMDGHVRNTQSFVALYQYIQENGPDQPTPYYTKGWATYVDAEGTEQLMPPATDTKLQGGGQITWPTNDKGEPGIPQYSLSGFNPDGQDSGLLAVLKPAVADVLRSTKDDDQLNGALWTSQQGVTARRRTNVTPSPAPAGGLRTAAVAEPGAKAGFAVKDLTSSYGLDIYDQQLAFDTEARTVTLPVKNWASRYLGAYVEFLDAAGTPIARSDIKAADPRNPGQSLTWTDNMFEALRGSFEPSATKSYLQLLSAGNAVFGVPVPFLDQTAQLTFLWPDSASTAQVLLGGLGVAEGFSDWDGDVDVVGVLGTCVAGYAFTGLSMVFTVKVANPFMWGLKGDTQIAFYMVCGLVGATAAVVGGGLHDTSFGKSILTKLAGVGAGIIFGNLVKLGLKKVFAEAMAAVIAEATVEITAEQALEKIPIAGEILMVASVAADIASLLATTIECLASPATYKIDVQYTMDLEVTVNPDEADGRDGIFEWPAVADHWTIQVSYPAGPGQSGGTTFTQAGPMPPPSEAGKTATPIQVTFPGIPAGGKVEVLANVYSVENWLAGSWRSGWFDAIPDASHHLATSGNITENLVPLTPRTTYSEKYALDYAPDRGHFWAATQFSLVASLAAQFDQGGVPGAALQQAFSAEGVSLASSARITVTTPGSRWTLDNDGVQFAIHSVSILMPDGSSRSELAVQNTTRPGPAYVAPACVDGQHSMCSLQNITINDREYQVGYAYRATGTNLPLNEPAGPTNVPVYAMQSISTLGQPETQIFEPTIGFGNPTFLAFNQFGVTSLFSLDMSFASQLDAGGAVPAAVSSQFQAFKRSVPTDARITVRTTGSDWTIGSPGRNPVYELKVDQVVVDGKTAKVIEVHSWPVPKMTDFYLDPRQTHQGNQIWHLRGVDLAAPMGRHTFDYDSASSWGAFTDVVVADLAFHPNGYVVAIDYDHHKLLSLRLGADATPDAQAPLAAPLSGLGLRDGLMNKPTAMTISADGRILILEEGNSRIQAFDVKGNPVPCFAVGQPSFALASAFAAELDQQAPSTALVQAFQGSVTPALAPVFFSDQDADASVAGLDAGTVDQTLAQAFVDAGFATSHAESNTPPTITSSLTVQTTQASQLWIVTVTDHDSSRSSAPAQAVSYDVRAVAGDWGVELAVYRLFSIDVNVQAPGEHWLLTDTTNAMTFDVTADSGTVRNGDGGGEGAAGLTAQQLSSVMPLAVPAGDDVHYVDLAVETKGYIYALFRKGTSEFFLQIYRPEGDPLTEPQTGVNAAKLTVNQWRTMFTLNFEPVLGPGQRTEPGVSEWIPSAPAPQ